jgi:primosomal protein N' (replication factor Y)
MTTVRVALDVPLRRTFDYGTGAAGDLKVGERVLVPFGKRHLVGVVVELGASCDIPRDRLKDVSRVLRDAPPLTDEDLQLIRFASDYYHYPLGQAIMSALPQRLKRVAPPSSRDSGRELRYSITEDGLRAGVDALPLRASAKRKLLAALQEGSAGIRELRALSATASAAMKDFVARGWVRVSSAVEEEPAHVPARPSNDTVLRSAQTRAVETIARRLGGFYAALLLGVTGSGKTEVYLRLAEQVVSGGGQVLMLVPEIALTPQLEGLVRARFPHAPVVTLHSGLNETERVRNWLAAQAGRARLLLGTRLAVFTPLPRLGLIVVDEEHDTSFKQTDGFCYSARDLAVARARQRGIAVVLGSATPSLETYHNACTGRYELIELPERINARPPRIECITVTAAQAHQGLSPRLLEALGQHLRRGEQSLVFINRRGYAPVLMCHACGWLSGCHRCSAQLVLHMRDRALHCHHCGHRAGVPAACPQCGNPALAPLGQGTQRVEEMLVREFPAARVLRIDRDSTRRKHAWPEMRERIRAREVDILVGTQILAKGHDFPHLGLVCVLNADAMLYSSDFRASERLYALLTQVAGRAGRGESQGQVLIQTEFPNHPVYVALREQDMHGFANQLLSERGTSGFPPYVHQALLRAEAPKLETALEFLEGARRTGQEMAEDVEIFDVVPATMVRLAGRERAQLLVQAASRASLHRFLHVWSGALSEAKSAAARWTLEVDPLEL